jgi:hypothetical protein
MYSVRFSDFNEKAAGLFCFVCFAWAEPLCIRPLSPTRISTCSYEGVDSATRITVSFAAVLCAAGGERFELTAGKAQQISFFQFKISK